jgi:phospholipid/cholesterol/gamma-HCH transport system substrate-binding protein
VGNSRLVGRVVALAALVVAVVVVAVILLSSGSSYTVKAYFQNASQLVKGNLVQVAGAPVGDVTDLQLSRDGQAEVTMKITDGNYKPLHRGTIATVRQASLSGVANRYIDLQLPSGNQPNLPNNGVIPATNTNSAVDLDQLFDTFDAPTRAALSGTIRGFGTLYGSQGQALQGAYLYLNPELSSSSRLFNEINFDTPLLTRFVVASSKVVTDLAARQNDLSGLVDHLANATGAIASQKTALASALQQLPPFMRQANTTFVNLRTTLDDLTPLVNDSKPVAKALRPLLAQLRPFARDARPTLRDLSALIFNKTPNSDLVSLTNTTVPVRNIAIGPVQANGATRPGSFPVSTDALNQSTPELAYARPYSTDLLSWFSSFGTSGDADANGSASRSSANVNAFANVDGVLNLIPSNMRQQVFNQVANVNQRNRCPGSVEHGTVYKPSPDFNCDPTQTLPGP